VSRIGKYPIEIPSGVTVNYNDYNIEVQGPKGKLELKLRPEVSLTKEDNILTVNRKTDAKTFRAMHGLYRVLINNMVVGVSTGFTKKLEIIGTGYKAQVDGKKLVLNIGYSYPYVFEIPEGIQVTVEDNTKVSIHGIDKQLVGQSAAVIRKMRPPEPYKGKGIKYTDEVIKRKAGKTS